MCPCLSCTRAPTAAPSTPDASHQCIVEIRSRTTAAVLLPNAAQEAVGLLCSQGTLVTHSASTQYLRTEGCSSLGENFALPLLGLHEFALRPFLHPAKVPLDASTQLADVSLYTHPDFIICKLAEGAPVQ